METVVKTYRNAKEYQRGLNEMQASGWTLVGMVEKTKPRGCLSIFPVGSDLIATYQRDAASVPVAELTVRAGQCPSCGESITATAFYCPTCSAQLRS